MIGFRYELRKRGIKKLKVVYSKEPALTPIDDMTISCRAHCICPPGTARKCTQRRQVPGSNAFVPSTVGLIIAGEVVKDLSGFGGRACPGGALPRPADILHVRSLCHEQPPALSID